MAQIIVADSGENQIVIVGGANDHLQPSDIKNCRDIISECTVLLTQMEVPVDTTLEALRIKSNTKGISIFNAAPAQSNLPADLYSLPTIFCVNETEASLLTGLEVKNVADATLAITKLQEHGCKHIIITLGELGAVYAPPASPSVFFPAPKAVVVDTTGAGDAFLGALALFLSESIEPDYLSSVKKAIIAASISVERPGTQTSFPVIEEISKRL